MEEIYVCEQCGKRQRNASINKAHVFGKVFYFCSTVHLDYWLKNHDRGFTDPYNSEEEQ